MAPMWMAMTRPEAALPWSAMWTGVMIVTMTGWVGTMTSAPRTTPLAPLVSGVVVPGEGVGALRGGQGTGRE